MAQDLSPNQYIRHWLNNVQNDALSRDNSQYAVLDQDPKAATPSRHGKPEDQTRHHRILVNSKRSSSSAPSALSCQHDVATNHACLPSGYRRHRHASESQIRDPLPYDAHENGEHKDSRDGKKYERRARHKTKTDKYDFKPEKKRKRKDGGGQITRKQQRKRRKKSGAALNREFRAPNVDQSRLSLKLNANPGLFNKGKASSPQQRRGLPDLTFAEMAFLSRRRELDEERCAKQREKEITKKKSFAHANKEVSDYFSRPLNAPGGHPQSEPSGASNRQVNLLSRTSSPAKLGGIPPADQEQALRQHSDHIVSDKRPIDTTPVSLRINHNADFSVPRRYGKNHKASTQDCATSFVSWSASPPRHLSHSQQNKDNGTKEHFHRRREQFDLQNHLQMTQSSGKASNAQQPEQASSVSNSSLAVLARESLRANGLRYGDPSDPQNSIPEVYSLDDLRDITRLPSLLASPRHLEAERPILAHHRIGMTGGFRQMPSDMQRTTSKSNAVQKNVLSTNRSPPVRIDESHRRLPVPGARNAEVASSREPRFLGEFYVNPTTAHSLLGLPALPSHSSKYRHSTTLRNTPKQAKEPPYFELRPIKNTNAHPEPHVLSQNTHEDTMLVPELDKRSFDPATRDSHLYGMGDSCFAQEENLQEALIRDLFPLDEADFDGRHIHLGDNDLGGASESLLRDTARFVGPAEVPRSQACTPANVNSISQMPWPRCTSQDDASLRTAARSHPFAGNATSYTTKPRPAAQWSFINDPSPESSCSQPLHDIGGIPRQFTRPTLLRAEELLWQGTPPAGGGDLMEGFWQRRMLY